MDNYFKNQEILKNHTRKELLSLFRKSITSIDKLSLNRVSVTLSIDFSNDRFSFHVTAFDNESNNKTFTAYDFLDIDETKQGLNRFIREIKTDDFERIEAP